MLGSLLSRPTNRKPLTPGDPRLVATYRFQFFVYSVRHLGGIIFFAFLTAQAFNLYAAPVGYALAVFGLAYTGFVFLNLFKLFRAWKRNEAIGRSNRAVRPGL